MSFSGDVDVDSTDLLILNETLGNAVVNLSGATFQYNPTSFVGEWDLSTLSAPLEPGYYELRISGDVTDSSSGLQLDGDTDGTPGGSFNSQVYAPLPGDANLDGVVDVLNDGFTLVSNLGRTSGVSWRGGDFNADGRVDVLGDAFALIENLGRDVRP